MSESKNLRSDSVVRAQVIPTWQPAFLAELEQTGNLAASCRAANVDMHAVSGHRRRNREFGDRVLTLLRERKLTRDPNDHLVEIDGRGILWDEPWQEDEDVTVEQAFLSVLGASLNASLACRRVGVSYESYRRRREKDPDFDRLVRLAVGRACDELEGSLYSRALLESDAAAVTLLRAYRSEVYRTTDVRPADENKGLTLEEAMRRGFTQRQQGELIP